ncbi:MAG: hypothetical protein GW903_02145 [Alphaproteobacteria bacterium]|nr:hypothetical protein [Alphaproteobacteria bacterium]NCQ87772.1 hypothetical protein [Alphaproteobacteria bacterium]NCT05720.1 hypothetical protein [Alphaproteobacteria bacterium]
MQKNHKTLYYLIFVFALFLNVSFWVYSKTVQTKWANVPPVPKSESATMMALSDKQLAYRGYNTMLQNIGSTGGYVASLLDYNYADLKQWFFLLDHLDPVSDVTPFLASYYYGAVKDSKKLDHVLDYLAIVGTRDFGNKWRWLGHGVFIARHIQKDNVRALELANILAANQNPDIGIWAKQMPAIIQQSEGNTEEAYKIMINLIQDSSETLHPNEINYMVDYICNTILKEDTTLQKPDFCDNL